MSRSVSLIISSAAVSVSLLAWSGLSAAERAVDFRKEVLPLLQAKCFACHGPAANKGGLRLHRQVDFGLGGDGGPIVVPGKADESRLIRYVTGAEKGKIMPPAGERLTGLQVGVLRGWINGGAQ